MSVSSLVSCIVPVYNAESTIQRCLDSILNQTYKNIEIIIVDDNSTDSSIKKIYQNSDKRIKIIQHKNNEGPSKSRNDGILTAKGEYICFIDSDDYYSQNFILDLYSVAQDRDADMVMSEIRSIKGNVASILPNAQSTLFTFATKIKALPNGAAWNKLYRKKFLLDNNLYFPVGKYWEDSFFTIKAIYYSNCLVTTKNCYYNYVRRENSITKSLGNIEKLKCDGLSITKLIYDFIKDKNLTTDSNYAVMSFISKNIIIPSAFLDEKYYTETLSLICLFKNLSKIQTRRRVDLLSYLVVEVKLLLYKCLINMRIKQNDKWVLKYRKCKFRKLLIS